MQVQYLTVGCNILIVVLNRFGAWVNFTSNAPTYIGANKPYGDVYFDLFQDGNFNWSQGNREAIWNIEQDPNIWGG